MKTPNLDRRLKQHDRLCKMFEFNLGTDRYCSCGRDAAIVELKVFTDGMEWLLKAKEYLDRNDILYSNSEAGEELREIVERAEHERIIGTKPRTKQTKG